MSRKRKNKRQSGPPGLAVPQEELTAILAKAQAALSAEESAKLRAAVELIGFFAYRDRLEEDLHRALDEDVVRCPDGEDRGRVGAGDS